MPFRLKDPKMLYNQKSLQHVLKCSLLCLEREQLLSCAHQQQHTEISKWTISILTENTGTNLGQNGVVVQMHLCLEYCPPHKTHKDLPTVNWSLPCFFYAFFQNRRWLQLQCAAADVHFSLLHIWFNREVYKCVGGEAPQRSLFIESTWFHTSVIAHCCGYLCRVTLRATFISPQHQETAGCTFAHLVDPQVQQKKKKKKASYSMEFSKISTVKVFRAK